MRAGSDRPCPYMKIQLHIKNLSITKQLSSIQCSSYASKVEILVSSEEKNKHIRFTDRDDYKIKMGYCTFLQHFSSKILETVATVDARIGSFFFVQHVGVLKRNID